jgi:hypothetical protein
MNELGLYSSGVSECLSSSGDVEEGFRFWCIHPAPVPIPYSFELRGISEIHCKRMLSRYPEDALCTYRLLSTSFSATCSYSTAQDAIPIMQNNATRNEMSSGRE